MNCLITLQERLGYSFKNSELLQRALTHKSLHKKHYEKLEFLGDSVLNMVVSAHIYNEHIEFDEGSLSMLRANIVNKNALFIIAQNWELEQHIQSAPFQRKSTTILADVVEAIVAAVYLDGGMDAVTQLIIEHFSPIFQYAQNSKLKDSKTALQELTISRHKCYPHYKVINTTGDQHNKRYIIECSALNQSARAEARSKRMGEQLAAKQILEQISE